MEEVKKRQILEQCNHIPEESLVTLINEGKMSIDELVAHGIENEKLLKLKQELEKVRKRKEDDNKLKLAEGAKRNVLDRMWRNNISAAEIRRLVLESKIGLEDLKEDGFSPKLINAIRYYLNNNYMITPQRLDQLSPLEEGRTDVYFVGLKGTGKSTMLSGLSLFALNKGFLIDENSDNNKEGGNFMSKYLQAIKQGVLPEGTPKGSYSYSTISFANGDTAHPFNIVDVPGEIYSSIFENDSKEEINSFMNYIRNRNKKILIFTIDPTANFDENSGGESYLDQSVVYPNILSIFQRHGVLEQTDAIYLIVNKFDTLTESRYAGDIRTEAEQALDYLNDEYKALINNCKYARDNSNNKFKIKVSPYSIGKLQFNQILESFDDKYSAELKENLVSDSFVVSKGKFKKYS